MAADRTTSNSLASGRILKAAVGAALVLAMFAPAVDAIGFRTDATSSTSAPAASLTLTPPIGGASGTQAADVMLAAIAWRGSSGALNVTPAGWTEVRCDTNTDATPDLTQCIYWKAAATSLEGPATWTFDPSVMASGGLSVYSAVDSDDPVFDDAGQSNGVAPLFTVAAPGVDTNQANQRVVSFVAIDAQTSFSPPASTSERYDRATTTTTPSVTVEASDYTQVAATPTSTLTAAKTATAGTVGLSVGSAVSLRQPTISFDLATSSVTEGDAASLVVEISGRSGQATTFNYARTAGTATNGVDFAPVSGSASIPANTDSVTLTINSIEDSADEVTEWINFTLSGVSNAVLASPATHTLDILDDDNPTVNLSVPDGNASETVLLAAADTGVFRITRTAPLELAVPVAYVLSGTGLADNFTVSGGSPTSATIPAGLASVDVVVTNDDDLAPEATKTLTLTLQPSGSLAYQLGNSTIGSMKLISNDGSSLSIQPAGSGSEGNFSTDDRKITVEVTLTPIDPTNTISVDFRTVPGTAKGGSDYQNKTGTLVFPPNTGSLLTPGLVTINLTEDFLYEPDESFTVVLSNPQFGRIAALPGEVGTSVLTIAAGDEPVVAFSTVSAVVQESGGPLQLTLTATPTPDTAFTVDYQTFSGTAVGGTVGQGLTRDFVTQTGTVTFQPGNTTKTIAIAINNDLDDEQTETFEVVLTGTSAAARLAGNSTNTVSVVDNDDPVFLVTQQGPASEPDEAANFTISRAGSSSALNVTVFYELDGGDATEGDDYVVDGVSGEVFLPAGVSAVTVTIEPTDDATDELTETLRLNLVEGATYNLSALQSNATMQLLDDDDPVVTVLNEVAGDADAHESGNEGTFTVSRAGSDLTLPINVTLLVSGSATGGADYVELPGYVVIPAGVDRMTLVVVPIDDATDEPDESVKLTAVNATGYSVAVPGDQTVTIEDDDLPSVTVATVDAVASEPGATDNATFRFTRTLGDTTADLVIDYVVDGTATPGVDYEALSGTVTIDAGNASADVTVRAIDDLVDEAAETVNVTLAAGPVDYVNGLADLAEATVADDEAEPIVAFDDPSSSAGEAAGALELDVGLSAASARTVTVHYAVTGGNASNGADFTLAEGDLTFAPGETLKAIEITLDADDLNETNEGVQVTLSSPLNGTLGGATHALTIVDDDAAPSVGFELAAASVSESDGTATIGLELSDASGRPVAFTYSVGGNASSPSDYTGPTGTVVFAPGQTTLDLSLALPGDVVDEADETVILTLTSVSNGTLGATTVHTLTIVDDEDVPMVGFATADSSGVESSTPANLTLLLSHASAKPVSASYGVTGGPGVSGDFSPTSGGTVTFAPGETSKTLSFTVVDDAVDEGDEFLVVNAGPTANATAGAITQHTYTILDDDASPTVALRTATSDAGEGSTTLLLADLSAVSGRTVTVGYTVAAGTAGAGDFTAASGTLTFAAGNLTQSFSVASTDDALDEADETVLATLSAPLNATLGTASHTHTVQDDDEAPTVAFVETLSTIAESDTPASLAVELSAPSGKTVTVDYAAADGSADGDDYDLASGTLTFAPGETSHEIEAGILSDGVDEDAESFTVALADPANATVAAPHTHNVTITDDDASPEVAFALTESEVDEASSPTAALVVELLGDTAREVTVDYEVTGGTASNGTDFVLASGTLTFAAGSLALAQQSIEIAILDDAMDEANETVVVELSSPVNATLGGNTTHTLAVADDDEATSTVNVRAGDKTAGEKDLDPGTFIVTRTGDLAIPIVVLYNVGGTASPGVDYDALSGSVEILANSATGIIVVGPLQDSLNELAETVQVTLLPSFGYDLGKTLSGVVSIKDDDAVPVVAFTQATRTVEEGNGTLDVDVTLSAPSGRTVTVKYSTLASSAKSPADFAAARSVIVTFLPGETNQTISIPIVDDGSDEVNETFSATLSSAVGAKLGVVKKVVATIVDDDEAPTVQFALAEDDGPESGSVLLQVTLSDPSGRTVTVAYAVTGGSAVAGTDYSLRDGTLTFRPGEDTKTIRVSVRADTLVEGNEDFVVALSNPVNATPGTIAVHTYTIDDQDD